MGKSIQRARAKEQSIAKPVPRNQPAVFTLAPSMNAACIASRFSQHKHGREGEFIIDLTDELMRQCDEVKGGDLQRAESMLVSQAHSLDVLFTQLALRASLNIGSHLRATETYLRLALKAQSQCRATLETLATIKNPPVVFAKQANISHGHQQVNNGGAVPVAGAGESTNQPSKLLEAAHGNAEWMDAGAAGATTAGDPPMATLGVRNRSTDG